MDDERPMRRARLRGFTPYAATAGLVAVLGLGVALLQDCSHDPAPPLSEAATAAGALRLRHAPQGLPPYAVAVPVPGHRVTAALIDVRRSPGAPVAVVRVVVDGRASIQRLAAGAREHVAGLSVEVLQAYPRARREDEAADVVIRPA